MFEFTISDSEFQSFRAFIYENVGINLSNEKKTLVTSRLSKRLRHHSLRTFKEYYDLVMASSLGGERQIVIDLLTTNETYFFREPKHFSFLKTEILAKWKGGKTFRVWSAASSTGEEAYSIAMILDDVLAHHPWEIFGSDISSRVLKAAQKGHYQQNRIDGIPKAYLQKYCLKGIDEQEGTLLIDRKLREKVTFASVNLKKPLGEIGDFDLIFLRNVLIYFDAETKKHIVNQVANKLKPGGHLFIGHSESLKSVHDELDMVIPTVYRQVSGSL